MSLEDQRTVGYACKNDDERFIQDPGVARTRRMGWIHEVIRWRWRWRSAKVEEIEEAFLEMLEGKEEDVWLWVDGDDVALPNPDSESWCNGEPPYALAAKALRTRQAFKRFESGEMAEMRQRVQKESPEVRAAAIAWLVLTSKALKRLESEHGFMDNEEWDLSGMIGDWWWSIYDVWHQLPEAPTEEFERAMEKEGHTCHTKLLSEYRRQAVGRWLYVQSVLFPERADAPVNLMRRNQGDKIQCQACCSYANQHYSQRQKLLYEPSSCAVLLAIVHRYSGTESPSFLEWIAALSSHPEYKKVTSAGHQLCQKLQSELKRQPEAWDLPCAQWIQLYPPSWHYALSGHSSRTWKLVDPILDSYSGLSSRAETTPDFATWLAAAMWTLCTEKWTAVGPRVRHFDHCLKNAIKELASTSLPRLHPPNTDTVEIFRRKIDNSSHTCWDGHDPRWYASAVSYLNDGDDPEFVPYLPYYSEFAPSTLYKPCNKCHLVNYAHQFAKALSNSFRPDDELSKHLAEMKDQFQELGYQWSCGDNQESDSEAGSRPHNEDVPVDLSVYPALAAPDTIPQMTLLERTTPQPIVSGSYEVNPHNIASSHLPAQGFQPTALQDTNIPEPLSSIYRPILPLLCHTVTHPAERLPPKSAALDLVDQSLGTSSPGPLSLLVVGNPVSLKESLASSFESSIVLREQLSSLFNGPICSGDVEDTDVVEPVEGTTWFGQEYCVPTELLQEFQSHRISYCEEFPNVVIPEPESAIVLSVPQSIGSHENFQTPYSSNILSANYGTSGFGTSSHGNLPLNPPPHSLSNSPPTSVSQQGRQSISSHENFQTPHSSLPASHNVLSNGASGFGISSHRNLSPDPPSYDDVSSTYNPPVSMEIENTRTVGGSHQISQAIPPPSQLRTKEKKLRPKKAVMIREVKKFIIDELRGAGARLSKFRDEYTLPWTQLEQNLKEWRIEMHNWPQEVERDDSIKAIHGLNNKEVKRLWDAVREEDPEKRLQFRRSEEGTSRKRRADALDDDNSEGRSGPKSQRLNEQGFRV